MWAVWWVWKICPFEFLCETHIALPLRFDDHLRMRDNTYCSAALQYKAGHLKLTTEKCRHFPWIWTEVQEVFAEVFGQPSYVGDEKFILNFCRLAEGNNLGRGGATVT